MKRKFIMFLNLILVFTFSFMPSNALAVERIKVNLEANNDLTAHWTVLDDAQSFDAFNAAASDLSTLNSPTDVITDDFTDPVFLGLIRMLAKLGPDDPVLRSTVSYVSAFEFYNYPIKSIAGIENFTSLMYLICPNNKIMGMNVSNNPKLLYIDCSMNYMNSPDSIIGWQSVGTLVFEPQIRYALTVETVVGNDVVNTDNWDHVPMHDVNVEPNTAGFDDTNYIYTFTGWTIKSGGGSFVNVNDITTIYTTGESNAVIRANYTREPIVYGLTVITAVDSVEVDSTDIGTFATNQHISVSPDTSSFELADYVYTFQGWSKVSGSGSFANVNDATTTYTTGASNTVIQANYSREPIYNITIETVIDGDVVDSESLGSFPSNQNVNIRTDTTGFAFNHAGYTYRFTGWTIDSGSGNIADPASTNTTYTTAGSVAVIQANYASEEKTYRLIVRTTYRIKDADEPTGYWNDSVQQFDKNFPIIKPTDIEANFDTTRFNRNDFDFIGWEISNIGAGSFTDPAAEITQFNTTSNIARVDAIFVEK